MMLRITLWLVISCFSCSVLAQTSTLTQHDLVGKWVVPEPHQSIRQKVAEALSPSSKAMPILTITPDFHVMLKRTFDKNRTQITTADSITTLEDIFHITLKDQTEHKRYKLVLSGWSQQESLRLFGYVYLYDEKAQIFNGWPITFKKKDSQ